MDIGYADATKLVEIQEMEKDAILSIIVLLVVGYLIYKVV